MILEVINGNFGYGAVDFLKDINIKIESKEILSVLGPNGIGKTTLLKCCLGLLNWRSGETRFFGENIKDIKPKEFWSNVSYIPQSHNLAFSYKGIDMVLFGKSAHMGMFEQPQKKDYEIAYSMLKYCGIEYLAYKNCNHMSGGEFQMVLIAKALINEPKLIVLDEPETGLDFHNQILVLNLVDRLVHEDGISAIINTHYPSNALTISDKTMLINKDGNYLYGDTKDILIKENISKAFNVEVIINEGEYEGKKIKSILPVAIR